MFIYSAETSRYYGCMKTHQEIDDRSLAMARAIVKKVDADPEHRAVENAREVCRRWHRQRESAAVSEWLDILEKPWREVRSVLLDEGERGKRLRQSSPFVGILTNRERWQIYREYKAHDPD
jgi:hypothetical protein